MWTKPPIEETPLARLRRTKIQVKRKEMDLAACEEITSDFDGRAHDVVIVNIRFGIATI